MNSTDDRPVLIGMNTHKEPHADEYWTALLLATYGMNKYRFPGDEMPSISFTGKEEEREGIALIGMGGGKFDEHKLDGRLPNECATTLVAKYLGVAELPELRVILQEAKRADCESGQEHFEMGNIVKLLHGWGKYQTEGSSRERSNKDPYAILEMMNTVFEARILQDGGKATKSLPSREGVRVSPALKLRNRDEEDPFSPAYKLEEERDDDPLLRYIVVPLDYTALDLGAVWLLQNYGHKRFRAGDEDKEMDLLAVHPHELSKWEGREDTIFIGWEGGHFGRGGQYDTINSLAEWLEILMFKKTKGGIKKVCYLEVKLILKEFTRYEQSNFVSKPFELPAIIQTLRDFSDLSVEKIHSMWVVHLLRAQNRESREYFVTCPRQFMRNNGILRRFNSGLIVGIVKADLRKMSAHLRTSSKNCGITMQKGRTGNAQVFCKPKFKHLIPLIAREILRAEGGTREDLEELDRIIAEGKDMKLPGAQHWYFFQKAGQLLNGSLSHEAEPTPLSLEELEQVVLRALEGVGILPLPKPEPRKKKEEEEKEEIEGAIV